MTFDILNKLGYNYHSITFESVFSDSFYIKCHLLKEIEGKCHGAREYPMYCIYFHPYHSCMQYKARTDRTILHAHFSKNTFFPKKIKITNVDSSRNLPFNATSDNIFACFFFNER